MILLVGACVLMILVAKALGAGMVIARFNRIPYVKLLAGVGIDAAAHGAAAEATAGHLGGDGDGAAIGERAGAAQPQHPLVDRRAAAVAVEGV